jgi:hypothetical protein
MRLPLSRSSPAVDLFDIETPIASDLERWQLSGLEQAINGAWVHFKIFGELLHGDYRDKSYEDRCTSYPALSTQSFANKFTARLIFS